MDHSIKSAPISPAVISNPTSNTTNEQQMMHSNTQQATTSNPLADIDQNDLVQIMKILQKYNFKVLLETTLINNRLLI